MYGLAQPSPVAAAPANDAPSAYGLAMSGADPNFFSQPLPVPGDDQAAAQIVRQAQASWPLSKVPDQQKSLLLHRMLDAYKAKSNSPLADKMLQAVQAKRSQLGFS